MRINIIPVQELADQHLRAEYNEIKFSADYYRRSKRTKLGIDRSRIGKKFTLSTGHAYMWYDKFKYVLNRLDELCVEMKARGYAVNYPELNTAGIDQEWNYGNYSPTSEEKKINVERIVQRIEMKILEQHKERFYTLRGKVLSIEEWRLMYKKYLI